jgi:hypothetical protein
MLKDLLLNIESKFDPVEKRKVCVVEAIRTIEGLMEQGDTELLMECGNEYGKMVLNALPNNVQEFVYPELSEVRASRDVGTETWDDKQAMAWALEG